MTKTIAEQKADLLKKLAELEELEKQEWPKNGDKYFWFWSGSVDYHYWDGDDVDLENKLIGNCHRTEAEALAWGAKRDKLLRVTARLKELQGGWVPDWVRGENKYFPYYDHDERIWRSYDCECTQSWFATPPFKTRESLQSALDELGDDMNVFLEVL